MAVPRLTMFVKQAPVVARSRACWKIGKRIAARTATIEITTNSSPSVNAFIVRVDIGRYSFQFERWELLGAVDAAGDIRMLHSNVHFGQAPTPTLYVRSGMASIIICESGKSGP